MQAKAGSTVLHCAQFSLETLKHFFKIVTRLRLPFHVLHVSFTWEKVVTLFARVRITISVCRQKNRWRVDKHIVRGNNLPVALALSFSAIHS